MPKRGKGITPGWSDGVSPGWGIAAMVAFLACSVVLAVLIAGS